MHIFVTHAADREGRLLAALVQQCDTDRQFEVLAVQGDAMLARMHRFLVSQNLRPDVVGLPFVVLLDERGGGPERRTVLHGAPLHRWLAGIVQAVVDAQTPIGEEVLGHLAPYTRRLVAHVMHDANANATAHPHAAASTVSPPPPPPPPTVSPATGVVERRAPPRVAHAVAADVPAAAVATGSPEEEDGDDAMGHDFIVDTESQPPTNHSAAKRGKTINISEVMAQSKRRETMNQRKTW